MAVSVVDKVVGNLLPFAWGDGSTVAFNLGLAAPMTLAAPTLYKKDWQGAQPLYTTERTNTIPYSNQFDAPGGWTASNVTATPTAATAPDGTLTATLMDPVAGSGSIYRAINILIGDNTISLYAKSKGVRYLWFIDGPGAGGAVWFDLLNGVVGTIKAGYTADMQALGDGWYRCSVHHNGVYTYLQFGPSDADNSTDVDATGTNGIYIWEAQVEAGLITTPTIHTSAAPVAVTDYAISGRTVTIASAPAVGVPLLYKQFDEHGLKL